MTLSKRSGMVLGCQKSIIPENIIIPKGEKQ